MAKFINHYINQTLLYSWSVSTFMWVVLPQFVMDKWDDNLTHCGKIYLF